MDNGTEKLIITREVAQTVVNYLADRPYREVAQLVQAMLVLPAADGAYLSGHGRKIDLNVPPVETETPPPPET